jgi:microcystin-dependent protein
VSDLTPAELPAVAAQEAPTDQAPALTPEESTAAALAIAVQAAVKEALAAAPAWVKRLGTCKGYSSSTLTANVLLDGDTAEVPCMIQTARPNPGDRVVVEIVPGDVGSVAWVVGKVGGSDLPAGSIMWFTGDISSSIAPPSGYLQAYGQLVNIADYPALYSVYQAAGYPHGADSGNTFRLPDLRGRAVIAVDNMGGTDAGRIGTANTVGAAGGAESVTIDTTNLPSHNHGLGAATGSLSGGTVSGTTSPDGSHTHTTVDSNNMTDAGAATTGGTTYPWVYSNAGSPNTGAAGSHTHTFSGSLTGGSVTIGGSTDYAGGGTALNVLPPHMVVHGCVKY